MKLLILIPAYNEEEGTSQVIASMPRELENIDSIQVLVVDDGSKDRTAEMAKQAGAILVSYNYNRGVGAAFKTGLGKAPKLVTDQEYFLAPIRVSGRLFYFVEGDQHRKHLQH